jgi:hypothetical protein
LDDLDNSINPPFGMPVLKKNQESMKNKSPINRKGKKNERKNRKRIKEGKESKAVS